MYFTSVEFDNYKIKRWNDFYVNISVSNNNN